MADLVRHSVHDQVARIVIDRPELHNAFDDEVMCRLNAAFEEAGRSDQVRVVVLASEGKSFCAGADITWMKRMVNYSMDENIQDAAILSGMLRTIRDCPKPVIARVHGATIGGGVGLVAAADMAVAIDSAVFSLSEVKLGILPAVISPFVLEKIGAGAARRYALTAERFDAHEARRIGLLSEVCDTVDRMDQWIEDTTVHLKRNGPAALAACKQVLSDVGGADWTTIQDLTTRRIAELRVSPEGQEGLKAFLEKRHPNWIDQPK